MTRRTIRVLAQPLTAVAEVAGELLGDVAQLAARADTGPGVRARAYDASRRSPSPWCFDHGQAVVACHRAGHSCRGEPVDHVDPTGDAAMAEAGSSPSPLVEFQRAVDKAYRHLLEARRIRDEQLADPPPPEKGCELCDRVKDGAGRPVWQRMYVRGDTMAGLLEEPVRVCRWHYDWAHDPPPGAERRLPTDDEVLAHAEGRNVRRAKVAKRRGRWFAAEDLQLGSKTEAP